MDPADGAMSSVVQDNTHEGTVDLEAAFVVDETQFLELIHEKVNSGARRADRLRQRFLRDRWKNTLRLVFLSVASQQQKRASQSFLRRVKQLIDQVRLNADVPGQHISDEAVGKLMFGMEDANHLVFFNDEYSRRCNRGGRPDSQGLPCETPFSKKVARAQDCHHRFFAGSVDHGQLHTSLLNIHHGLSGIALHEGGRLRSKLDNPSCNTRLIEEHLGIEV